MNNGKNTGFSKGTFKDRERGIKNVRICRYFGSTFFLILSWLFSSEVKVKTALKEIIREIKFKHRSCLFKSNLKNIDLVH